MRRVLLEKMRRRLNLKRPQTASEWKRAVAWGLGGFFLFTLISFVVAAEVTSRSFFCRSCHIMEPYYQAWASSSHKDVECITCHMEPGLAGTWRGRTQGLSKLAKYLTNTEGTKPWAEISDASCLRSGCHESRLLEGEVAFGDIRFDHKPHLTETRRGRQLRCTSCHAQVVMGEHINVSVATCNICHFKDKPAMTEDSDCLQCHKVPEGVLWLPGNRAFEHGPLNARGVKCAACHATVTQGDGFVPKTRCVVCHNFPINRELLADHERLHQVHVTEHKVECTDCHNEITHGYEADRRAATAAAGSDSRRTARVECLSCHPSRHAAMAALADGTASSLLGETQPHVGPMFAARVECLSCHLTESPRRFGMTRLGDPAACGTCHGDFGGRELATWRAVLVPRLASAEAAVRGSRQPAAIRARAQSMVDLVRNGKFVHNADLARDLLDAAISLARTGRLPVGAEAALSGVDAGLRGETSAASGGRR